jgi:Atypical Arm repeat
MAAPSPNWSGSLARPATTFVITRRGPWGRKTQWLPPSTGCDGFCTWVRFRRVRTSEKAAAAANNNLVAATIVEAGGLSKIQELQNHGNDDVREVSKAFVDEHFGSEGTVSEAGARDPAAETVFIAGSETLAIGRDFELPEARK